MKIGIYGGSFDPPHYGHHKIAEYAIEKLNLDKLLIVPVGIASHGKNHLTFSQDRLNMCKLTFSDLDKVEVSSVEIDMDEVSYTYKTLMRIIEKYGSGNEYFEIIGEDSANYFDEWKEYKKILELSTVVILKREGYHNVVDSDKMITIDNPYFNVSSSDIRQKVKDKKDISTFVNKDILALIIEKKLYI